MTTRLIRLLPAAALCLTSALAAQQNTQQPPPVRQITNVTAVSHDSLAAVATAVEVAGGKVYVNDIIGHRVLMYDSMLANAVVVADSDPASPNAYGARPATLMPFRGDSALLVTPASLSMLVLSPRGEITRVMAMPSGGQGGIPALIGNVFGTPGFDARGRLAYFSPVRMQFTQRGGPGGPGDGGPISITPPDSAFIVRYDLASRTMDTAGVIRIPTSRNVMNRDDRGGMHMTLTAFPPKTVDDWAVTSDGRIAIVRGRDYHVDWLGADGTWTSTPRMPFTWERLDDEQKTVLIDSVQAAMQAIMDSMPARLARAEGGAQGAPSNAPSRGGDGGGRAPMVMIMTGPPGGGDGPTSGPGGGGPPRNTTISMAVPTVIKANLSDVPDYRPAFGQASVRADREGNLWIRTSTVIDGRPVYDIVNGRGEITDRVQLPAFRTIAGFGQGVVYLGVRDENGNTHLEKARMH